MFLTGSGLSVSIMDGWADLYVAVTNTTETFSIFRRCHSFHVVGQREPTRLAGRPATQGCLCTIWSSRVRGFHSLGRNLAFGLASRTSLLRVHQFHRGDSGAVEYRLRRPRDKVRVNTRHSVGTARPEPSLVSGVWRRGQHHFTHLSQSRPTL